MFEVFRRIKAKRAGFPYRIAKYWPAYHITFKCEAPNGSRALSDIYKAYVGDLVPVFELNGDRHFYRIRRAFYASGSDHIVSPLQFDITYHSSERV